MAAAENGDFAIKPEAVTPNIPTSEWPLLLKNYDKREYIYHYVRYMELSL